MHHLRAWRIAEQQQDALKKTLDLHAKTSHGGLTWEDIKKNVYHEPVPPLPESTMEAFIERLKRTTCEALDDMKKKLEEVNYRAMKAEHTAGVG